MTTATPSIETQMDERAARDQLDLWRATDATDCLRRAVRLVGADRVAELLSEMAEGK